MYLIPPVVPSVSASSLPRDWLIERPMISTVHSLPVVAISAATRAWLARSSGSSGTILVVSLDRTWWRQESVGPDATDAVLN